MASFRSEFSLYIHVQSTWHVILNSLLADEGPHVLIHWVCMSFNFSDLSSPYWSQPLPTNHNCQVSGSRRGERATLWNSLSPISLFRLFQQVSRISFQCFKFDDEVIVENPRMFKDQDHGSVTDTSLFYTKFCQKKFFRNDTPPFRDSSKIHPIWKAQTSLLVIKYTWNQTKLAFWYFEFLSHQL